MTPDGAMTSTVTSILFDGADLKVKNDELQAQVTELEKTIAYLKAQVQDARSFPKQLRGVMERLYSDVKDEILPLDADVSAMFERLKELVEVDDDEVWTVEQEYDLTVTYIVTVTGKVTATSEDEAKEKVHSDYLSFSLEDEGPLDDADLSWDLDSIQVG